MRLRLGFLGRGPTLHAGPGCAVPAGPSPAPSLVPGPPRIPAAAAGHPPSSPAAAGAAPVAGLHPGRQVSSCGASLLSGVSMRLYAGSCLLRRADSPAWLPDASCVYPNAPRKLHDASELVSSPLSDQGAVGASSGSARPGPWSGTTCLERHLLVKTGMTSARRGGASWKSARWNF